MYWEINLKQLGRRADFMSFYLESCIWPDEISRWVPQRISIKLCVNLGKSATETLAMSGQVSGKKAWAAHGKFKLTNSEKGETDEEQSQDHVHHFSLTSKISSWQAKQSIPHIAVAFYWDSVKIWEDFASNFGDKRTCSCITTTHCLTLTFSPGSFYQKQNVCRSLFPRLCHFDTTEVAETESQAVLNTLTEHDSRMRLKWQKRWEWNGKGTT
jgi:hypothetical protein